MNNIQSLIMKLVIIKKRKSVMSSNLYVSINIREHISGFDKLKFGYNEKIPSAPKTTLYNVSGLSCVQLSLRRAR